MPNAMRNRNLLIGLYPKVIYINTVRYITGYCVCIIYSSFKEHGIMTSCHEFIPTPDGGVLARFPNVFLQNVPSYVF